MIVVDASIAFKWLKSDDEEYLSESRLILQKHLDGQEIITVPSLLFMEVANALISKANTNKSQIKESLNFLNYVNLQIYSFKKIDLLEAAIEAYKYKTTFYDMLYAVVAKRNNCMLVTADENFIKKTRFKFVRHIKDL